MLLVTKLFLPSIKSMKSIWKIFRIDSNLSDDIYKVLSIIKKDISKAMNEGK